MAAAPGRNLVKHFHVGQGVILSRLSKTVKAVENVSFEVDEGETLGSGGRVRVRQVDHRAVHQPAAGGHSGKMQFGDIDVRKLRARAQGLPTRRAVHLPGSLCLSQSPHDLWRDHDGAVGDPRHRHPKGARGSVARRC